MNLRVFDPTRRVGWILGGGYTRDAYSWHLSSTGQPSSLYYNGVFQAQEAGSNSLNFSQGVAATSVLVGMVTSGCDVSTVPVLYRRTFDNGAERAGCAELSGPPSRVPIGEGTALASLISSEVGIAPGTPLAIAAVRYNAADISAGIRWATQQGAKLIVLDWGTPENSVVLLSACRFAEERGVILVCSAFEGYVNVDTYTDYPIAWNLSNVLPVVSTDQAGKLYASGYGTRTIAAPGRNIVSLGPKRKPIYGSGTSWSAPLIAGGLALLMHKYPGRPSAAYAGCLMRAADPITGGRQMDLTEALAAKKYMDMRTDLD